MEDKAEEMTQMQHKETREWKIREMKWHREEQESALDILHMFILLS